jgi:DNA-directed RNA polymerase sigma subunit (sigma70/sigma32)
MEDDAIAEYLREACAAPAMTAEEETKLSEHVLARDQHAESAGKRLIEANLGAVVSIAEGYADRGVHVLDLIPIGNDGLLLALKTFAGNPSQTFSRHAAACIEEAIAKAIPKP